MKQKIFLIIGIVLLSIFGVSIYNEFMANHTYYSQMLASRANRKLLLWSIVAVLIPLTYLIKAKAFSVKKFFIYILPASVLLYTVASTVVKESIMGGSAGFFILLINSLIIYFLGMYFILGLTAFGTWISKRYIRFKEIRRQEMLINFGIGLGIFLLIIYLFSMMHLIRGAIIWILFLGLGYMIRYMRKDMLPYQQIITDIAHEFKGDNLKKNRRKRIGIILLAISLIYYLYGFQLSYIPYSTARDANHEYMYIPRVIANNHGVLRGNVGSVASMAPGLRHIFITFFFALINPIKSRFWIAPDTIAVAMNFLSGIFVLIFGTGLIKEAINYFAPKRHEDDIMPTVGFYTGWMMLLFWLTSGMGAFLVFVDNKTDLGVMALTILALLSGFVFLKHILDNREQGLQLHWDSLKYIVISGVMFARAYMSKQTAFIDIALFGLLLIGLRIDSILAIGLGIMTVGMMGVLKIANAPDMMTPVSGKYIVAIGLVVAILGIFKMLSKKNTAQGNLKNKNRLLTYILTRVASFVAIVIVFKGPNVMINQINAGTFSPGSFIKSVLLVEKPSARTFLAANDATGLETQNAIDKTLLNTSELSVEQCKQTPFTKEELSGSMRKAIVTNEDVGRYVGYGWKEITKGNGLNLGYGLLKLFVLKDNQCYSTNRSAKLLCTNAQAIENFNVPTLQKLFGQVKQGSEAYDLLSGALTAYAIKGSGTVTNPAEFRDQIVALRQYYQNHTIKTEAGKISVPYRYLVPFNIVFNRSLQNLSSYYTDIGFVWMLLFMILTLGFIYAIANAKRFREDMNLVTLTSVTIIGRAIRWIIGGGILRYGMGLVVRTVITAALIIRDMFEHSEQEQEKTMMYIIIFLFIIRAIIQFGLNFIRISSQGGSGPFLRYKTNNGKTVDITSELQQQEVPKVGYGQKDVFNLQFPHYNRFIDYVKQRNNKDGVLIAGTYMQYFLDNQRNIKSDGMLNRFREQNSDGNLCKAYQRLQNSNIKYLVIDPNIGTVVMGEGNESLFNRFFAKLDAVSGKIQEDGAISSLARLRKAGYIKLFSTNNLGAKYAFSLDDDALKAKFGPLTAEELILLRAKISIARFFPTDGQKMIDFIGETFVNRIGNGKAIGDIADVYGKTIDEEKVFTTAVALIAQQSAASQELKASIDALTQDERLILLQYVALVNLFKSQNAQFQEFVSNLISQSLGGGSQLIVFELS